MSASKRYQALQEYLERARGVLVAFSGGIDSTLLLYAATHANSRVLAVTAVSPLRPEEETNLAKELAKQIGAAHLVIESDELSLPGFDRNPKDRCYLCKKALSHDLVKIANREGLELVADGSNADDLQEYRPGTKAIAEAGIVSPLAQVGLTKAEVRELARDLKLPNWDRPSKPCLATRFPYGTQLSRELLKRAEEGETALRKLGFTHFRLRCHGDLARLEISIEDFPRVLEFRKELLDILSKVGFAQVTLDLAGLRSGSYDLIS